MAVASNKEFWDFIFKLLFDPQGPDPKQDLSLRSLIHGELSRHEQAFLQEEKQEFADGELEQGAMNFQVRDGVCIDRDSETARYGLKYDYEVVPEGAEYSISIELENPLDHELALVGAALAEWENGFRLGGFTSRGLGKVKLQNVTVASLDYSDADQLRDYLLSESFFVV